MDAERVERAARALLEQRDARLAALKGTEDEDRPDARGFAWGALTSAESREEAAAVALRAALDAATEPAQAGEAVAWVIVGVSGRIYGGTTSTDQTAVERECDALNATERAVSITSGSFSVVPLYTHPAPPAPDAALLALVAPMVAALLRDAESAIEEHRGPGQHVGTPKVTVDALRLANVCHAIAAAAKWGAA